MVGNGISGHEFPSSEPVLPPIPEEFGLNITVYDDHLLVNDTIPIMRTRYF